MSKGGSAAKIKLSIFDDLFGGAEDTKGIVILVCSVFMDMV